MGPNPNYKPFYAHINTQSILKNFREKCALLQNITKLTPTLGNAYLKHLVILSEAKNLL